MRSSTRFVALVSLVFAIMLAVQPAPIQAKTFLAPVIFTPMSVKVGALHDLGTYLDGQSPTVTAQAVARIQRMGVQWVREEFRADHLHSSNQRPYDFHRFDRVISLERKAGLHILGLLDYNNTFHDGHHIRMRHDQMRRLTSQYIEFVTAVVEHYRHIITYWQIWNEPDIRERWRPQPNVVDYAYLLRRTYWAIKAISQKEHVVVAGTTTGNDSHAVGYLLDVHKDNGPFNITAFQPYAPVPTPQDLTDVAELRRLHHPIWFSEIGWPGQVGCSVCGNSWAQANYLSAIYLIAAVSGVQHCFWYSFRDGGTDDYWWDHFGLVEWNLAQKPAYFSFVIGSYLMDGSTVIGRSQLTPSVWLYEFANRHQIFYEMWNTSPTPQLVNARWNRNGVKVDSSTFSKITETRSHQLHVYMLPYSVDYLLPFNLKLVWKPSLAAWR